MTHGVLSEMTVEDVKKFRTRVVVVGFGSTEPHGPSLPYGTDFFICDALCRGIVEQANRKNARALMYPTLPIGNNVNFKAFPFACRMRVRTLMLTALDIIAALEEDGIRKIMLVCGHGGNTDTLKAVVREHYDRTPPERRAFVCLADSFADESTRAIIEHPSDHGGESETSQVMCLRPELVKRNQLANQPWGKPYFGLENVYFVRPWHRHVPLSAGGENRKATARKGELLLEIKSRKLAEFVVKLAKLPWQKDFPYPRKK
jgi:creatinine amidohydrolase